METILNNIFNSWTKCYNNHIFIENKCNDTIVIDDMMYNNEIKDYYSNKTFYIENTSNSIIYINTKINHLILNKCNNITLIINSTFISGLDIFHSNDVYIFNNVSIKSEYSFNFGENFTINVNADETEITLCINVIYNLIINKLNSEKKYNTFNGCLNLFTTETLYIFINEKTSDINGFDTIYGNFKLVKLSI